MLIIILYTILILYLYILIAYIVGTIKKNWGLMDIFYGPAYFVVAFTSLYLTFQTIGIISIRQIIVAFLVLFWSIRLATYVYIRNRGKPEDKRYAFMRKRWKEKGKNIYFKSLINIYLFQGLVILIVVFPVLWVNVNENPPIKDLFDFSAVTLWIGVIVWLIGFIFESIGDYQLYRFLHDPNRTKRVMDEGLWKYTQHPNYFGEVTQWWGLYIIALGIPWGFITIFGPIYITIMIIKVSGVRLLNKMHKGDDEYTAYRKRTSAFFPWFPKKKINE